MNSEVIKTLSCPPAPKPFAISMQYKSNMVPTGGTDGDQKPQAVEPSGPEPPTKKRKVAPAKPVPNEESCKAAVYTPKEYSKLRLGFIHELKDKGLSYKQACEEWDKSQQKKSILSGVSVSELLRRRFIPKGEKTNPWA